jgi:amidase
MILWVGGALLWSGVSNACESRTRAGSLELSTATLADLRIALEKKKTTSVALVQAYLARIADCNGGLHAVIAVNAHALGDAEALDRERKAGKVRGPLHGIPVIIKDNIDLADSVTTAGSLALAKNLRARNAPLVDRLAAAGVIVIAKANLSEWANFRSRWSSSGWSAAGGLAVNANDSQRTACGSSSGSAVAIAARLAPLAVGTETNGSIVCPASVNGVVGLKPTVGLISGDGIVPISHSQDTAGPMTAKVMDAALLLDAMVDPKRAGATNYSSGLKAKTLKGARLGVARFIKGYSPATDKAFSDAMAVLAAQGAVLVDIEQFDLAPIRELQLPILLTEFKTDLNAYLATTPAEVESRTLADLIAFNRAEPREMPWFGQDLFEQAQATAGLGDPAYLQALQKARAMAGPEGIDRLLKEHQVIALIAPTSGPAWSIDLVNGDRSVGSASLLAAISGYPHLTVPMGETAGLPVGLSFFGPAWSEQTLLALGYAFEQAQPRQTTQTASHSPLSRYSRPRIPRL